MTARVVVKRDWAQRGANGYFHRIDSAEGAWGGDGAPLLLVRFKCGKECLNPGALLHQPVGGWRICASCGRDPAFVLYRVYDRRGRLLYVGQTKDFRTRIRAHSNGSAWFRFAAFTTQRHYEARDDAIDAETEAIRNEHPRHNIAQSPTRPRRRRPHPVLRAVS